jgi:hypothetical protein
MPEPKDKQVMVNIEYTVYDLMLKVTKARDETVSSYIRSLILEDLIKQKLLTPLIMAQLLTGKQA